MALLIEMAQVARGGADDKEGTDMDLRADGIEQLEERVRPWAKRL